MYELDDPQKRLEQERLEWLEKLNGLLSQAGTTQLSRRPGSPERHYLVTEAAQAPVLAEAAAGAGYWLLSLIGNDERALEDNAFKVYCILSGPRRDLLILEHPLAMVGGVPTWPSIERHFGGAAPLEAELEDLFGIAVARDPATAAASGRALLVGAYPADCHPLRRDPPGQSVAQVRRPATKESLPAGVMILPVGPIHAGVIQPGYFAFHIAGEVVESLPVQLGYTHRGIERLFERRSLLDGWELAERVAGDSAFAHSMAYCQAVESLAGVEPPPAAALWRVLLLELERLCHHLADCAAMVHDMAFDALSSPMTVVQEHLVRLGAELTGHRLLRRVNRPGGLDFADPAKVWRVLTGRPGTDPGLAEKVQVLVDRFLDLALPVMQLPACRDRLIGPGVLTPREAIDLGAAGLPARASGLVERDFRLRHPQGVYDEPRVRQAIEGTTRPSGAEDWTRRVPMRRGDLTGDCFARTLLRLAEAETAAAIIEYASRRLQDLGPAAACRTDLAEFAEALRRAHTFDFGLGYVEAWRGEVCYWIMKGPHGGIYRCKVRDPSVFNWPALARAVVRKERVPGKPEKGHYENILADFPLINKSFNLSYAGRDL